MSRHLKYRCSDNRSGWHILIVILIIPISLIHIYHLYSITILLRLQHSVWNRNIVGISILRCSMPCLALRWQVSTMRSSFWRDCISTGSRLMGPQDCSAILLCRRHWCLSVWAMAVFRTIACFWCTMHLNIGWRRWNSNKKHCAVRWCICQIIRWRGG